MQISLKWVNEIINIQNINLDYLIEKLTLAGFEVEDKIEVEENNIKTISSYNNDKYKNNNDF